MTACQTCLPPPSPRPARRSSRWPCTCSPAAGTRSPDASGCARRQAGWRRRRSRTATASRWCARAAGCSSSSGARPSPWPRSRPWARRPPSSASIWPPSSPWVPTRRRWSSRPKRSGSTTSRRGRSATGGRSGGRSSTPQSPPAARSRRWPRSGPSTSTSGAASTSSGEHVNLGASPGDGFSTEPYLYVGPWSAERPGDDGYWNAPFGAVLRRSDLPGGAGGSSIGGSPTDAAAARSAAVAFLADGLTRFTR